LINSSLVRKVVQVEYSMLRAPLSILDRQVASRYLADDSKLRLIFERSLSSLDTAVGRFLDESAAAERGQDRSHDSAPTRPAAGADAETEAHQGETTTRGQEQGDTESEHDRDDALAQEQKRVAEALLLEQEEHPLVGELADADAAEKERQAELRAKHLVEEFEEQQRIKQARLEREG
jgi:hypothetical protein